MATGRQSLSIFLSVSLTLATLPLDGCKKSEKQSEAGPQAPATTYAQPSADQLYQLVAPIALFPDNLVAQVLAGSTYPDQITAADSWIRQNSGLKGDQLMQAADQQSWDVSIKGLTQFPDVLNQMATNLAWTSALGDAYYNIPQNVMNAVQVMRQRAYQAGNLKTNQQQAVSVQNEGAAPAPQASATPQPVIVQSPPQTIVIQPAQPQVVYVPAYNPAVVYGAPVAYYPGYAPPPSTGAMVATGLISFGLGIAVGAAISNNNSCCGWGWNSWGCGWHNSTVVYNRNVYVSTSNTFVNRNNYYNRNNVNVNNVNVNNVNRNNINTNNINRNNINTNNVNRNNVNANNYRTHNFKNDSANGNYTTPKFNQKYDQANAGNNRGNLAQNNSRPTTNQAGNVNRPNAGAQNQAGNMNRPNGGAQNASRQNVSQPQRDAARGYGGQADRGTSSGAFSNYSQGGSTRTNSARGQQSLSDNRASSAPQRSERPKAQQGQRGGGRRR
jgi:Protein of unknown function (DUF3300)